MQNLHTARLGIFGVLLFVVTTIVAGILIPGYSHTSQLISESYAIGTAYGPYLRFLGYLPSGLCIAAFAYYAVKALPKSGLATFGFAAFGIFYGLATVVVSIFPCDAGCDNSLVPPSISQLIHNLSGFLTYMIVPLSLILLGVAARRWPNGKTLSTLGIVCGITAMLFVGIFTANLHSGFAGLYQRIIEGSILLWVLACSLYFKKKL
ncbi:MAG: DUF998 domain-containing protein [Chitinophagaceae bacterium]